MRDMLDIWPPFPLVIDDVTSLRGDVDNVIAALQRRDRVHGIHLFRANGSAIENVLAAMQEPFPELTYLWLSSDGKMVPIVPDSFLGGSAPHLRSLVLDGIPFPDLPKLLLSATHLVYLHLYNIPHSGYISPDAVVTALSTLTNLNSLVLEFQSPRSHRDHASRPPPPLHTVLAILTHFHFKGVHEYLDDLMARIDAPQLFNLKITFFNDIVFDAPQFTQFISRTPTMKQVENTHVVFGNHRGIVNSSSPTSGCEVEILCRELDWQVSSLEQLCAPHFPPFSTLEDLYIYERLYGEQPDWRDNIENTLWLDLLHRFSTEESLPIQGVCAAYRGRSARARCGKNDRSVAHPAEYFLRGARASWACPGRHWEDRYCATSLRSHYKRFPLGKRLDAGAGLVLLVGGR